jgi:hypothetical protein
MKNSPYIRDWRRHKTCGKVAVMYLPTINKQLSTLRCLWCNVVIQDLNETEQVRKDETKSVTSPLAQKAFAQRRKAT